MNKTLGIVFFVFMYIVSFQAHAQQYIIIEQPPSVLDTNPYGPTIQKTNPFDAFFKAFSQMQAIKNNQSQNVCCSTQGGASYCDFQHHGLICADGRYSGCYC